MTARSLFLATAFAALVPMQSSATTLRAISFDEKVDNAAAIVLGKCTSTVSRWDPSGKWILTYNTFEIEKSMKGQPGQQLTIITPGGAVNGVHQETIGVPKFSIGDDQVVFVRNTRVGPTVLYFEQGAYNVERIRGERVVRPTVSEAALIDSQRGMAVSPEEPSTLREFEQRVHERIQRRELNERMQVLEREKREQATLLNVLKRNKMLVVLALLGAILATTQIVKRW
jgi:hypothetical protein